MWVKSHRIMYLLHSWNLWKWTLASTILYSTECSGTYSVRRHCKPQRKFDQPLLYSENWIDDIFFRNFYNGATNHWRVVDTRLLTVKLSWYKQNYDVNVNCCTENLYRYPSFVTKIWRFQSRSDQLFCNASATSWRYYSA